MKKKLMLLLSLFLLLMLLVCIGDGGTSEDGIAEEDKKAVGNEAAEGEFSYSDALPAVEFSRAAGFYEEPFELSLSTDAAGGNIYYTLDGSTPDENSALYEGELLIEDASERDNIWSDIPDTSAYFYQELLSDENGKPVSSYTGTGFPVDKCTVVKAVYIDEEGNKGPVSTASYFIGLKEKPAYRDIRVVSLSFDPELFFGHEDGIYVTGADFDEWFADHDYGKSVKGKWQYWTANYTRSGEAAEREVTAEIFDEEGKLLCTNTAGARVQGNVSRGTRAKSLSLYAKGLGDDGYFSPELFSDKIAYPVIELYAGSMEKTRFRNYLGQTLAAGCSFSTIESIPCMLFLEGEYWGMYDLGWRYGTAYVAAAYDIPQEDVIFVKNGEVKSDGENDVYYFKQLTSFIGNNDMSSAHNYEEACKMLDMDSYIDYYATMLYWARNGDWPGTNYALFRSRTGEGEGYRDGRWRFMLFDLDKLCYTKELTDYDSFYAAINGGGEMENMLKSLLKNKSFRESFRDRMLELADTAYSPGRVDGIIEDYLDHYEAEILHHHERFAEAEPYTEEMLEETLSGISYFFKNRRQYIEKLLAEYAG